MADIAPIGQNSIGPVERTAPAKGVTAPSSRIPNDAPTRSGDRVEISQHAKFLDQLRHLPEVRQNRVEQIRSAIADGSYETGEKVDEAIDRLVSELLDS